MGGGSCLQPLTANADYTAEIICGLHISTAECWGAWLSHMLFAQKFIEPLRVI
jgi:hypothetical protein